MALTNAHGYDGNWDGPGASMHGGNIRTWNAALRYPLSNVTGFQDSTVQRNRRGMPTLDGQAVGTPQYGAAGTPLTHSASGGTGAPTQGSLAGGSAMVLTLATGSTWGFTGVISGIGPSSDKIGDAVITYDFAMGDAADFAETWAVA